MILFSQAEQNVHSTNRCCSQYDWIMTNLMIYYGVIVTYFKVMIDSKLYFNVHHVTHVLYLNAI